MSDASGTYASPTGSEPQNGGAGQRQGIDEGHENVSFQLDTREENSGQEQTATGGATVCAEAGVEVVWQGRHGQQEAANKVEATAGVDASEGIWDLAAEAKGAGRRARGQRVC